MQLRLAITFWSCLLFSFSIKRLIAAILTFFARNICNRLDIFLHNLGSQQVGATGCVGPLNHIYCRSLEEFEIACNQRWADCVGGLFKTICSRTNEQINKQTTEPLLKVERAWA